MRRPGVRIPLPPAPNAFGAVAPKVAAATEGGHLRSLLHERGELRLGKPRFKHGKVLLRYVLQSNVDPERFYTGLTDDLPARLKRHNSGQVFHTAKRKPWRLKTYVAFSDRSRAAQFERYLKSSSGRAFLKKRLLQPNAPGRAAS
jgi:putative endonuclease